MSDGRTERPTPRRLREARRRGDVAVSRELCGAAAFLGGVVALAATGRATAELLLAHTRHELEGAAAGGDPSAALVRAGGLLARCALAPCGGAALAALVAGLVQTRGLVAPRALAPRLDRVSPARNLSRALAGATWGATALGAARVTGMLALAWVVAAPALRPALAAPRLPPAALLAAWGGLALRTGGALGALALAYGALDLALVARRRRRALMMTRGEVLREAREDQGDPQRRLERRRLHRAEAEAPPLARAACVVVNPTHVAVALAHAAGSDDPPVVVAKGAGAAGARLRADARRAGVPIVRDVPLARALFRLAEVGDAIPVELYDAAAAVLVHLDRPRPEAG